VGERRSISGFVAVGDEEPTARGTSSIASSIGFPSTRSSKTNT
jgi:hypothetical protein